MLYRILILISLMLTQATWAFNDIKINGDDNIYHGGEGDIHLTKIQGIPPAQFTQLAMQLGVTQSALQSFFKILEQQQVAAEDLDATLRRIASHYKQLKTKLAGLSSDDEQVNALRQQADTALEQGEFAQAEKLFNQAHDLDRAVASKALSVLQEMQAVYEKRQLSAADNKASNGDLMMTQLDYAAAADYYQQALRLIEELQANLPKDFAQKWDSYAFDAAFALDDAGDYRPAIVLLEKLLPLREQRLGKNHADVATTLNNLAGLYKAMGAYEKALPLYERTLAIVVEKLGKEHPNTQTIFMNFIMLRLQLAIQNRLGFDLHAVPEVKQATVQGVPLRSVQAEGMAAQADLQTGDALQQVDGQVVKSALEVVVVLMKKPAQTSVSLQVLRGAETLNLNLRLPEDYAPLAELGLE